MKWFAPLALTIAVFGQEPKFDVQTRLVLVPVSVSDSAGAPVEGLETHDFIVLDNGRRQTASVDPAGAAGMPISLVVAIQTSGISTAALEHVRKIGAMIRPVVTGSRGCAGVVTFSESVRWLADCTTDEDQLTQAIYNVSTGEAKAARMLDAVSDSIERLRQRPNTRRVILLISETRDRGSDIALDEAVLARTRVA